MSISVVSACLSIDSWLHPPSKQSMQCTVRQSVSQSVGVSEAGYTRVRSGLGEGKNSSMCDLRPIIVRANNVSADAGPRSAEHCMNPW